MDGETYAAQLLRTLRQSQKQHQHQHNQVQHNQQQQQHQYRGAASARRTGGHHSRHRHSRHQRPGPRRGAAALSVGGDAVLSTRTLRHTQSTPVMPASRAAAGRAGAGGGGARGAASSRHRRVDAQTVPGPSAAGAGITAATGSSNSGSSGTSAASHGQVSFGVGVGGGGVGSPDRGAASDSATGARRHRTALYKRRSRHTHQQHGTRGRRHHLSRSPSEEHGVVTPTSDASVSGSSATSSQMDSRYSGGSNGHSASGSGSGSRTGRGGGSGSGSARHRGGSRSHHQSSRSPMHYSKSPGRHRSRSPHPSASGTPLDAGASPGGIHLDMVSTPSANSDINSQHHPPPGHGRSPSGPGLNFASPTSSAYSTPQHYDDTSSWRSPTAGATPTSNGAPPAAGAGVPGIILDNGDAAPGLPPASVITSHGPEAGDVDVVGAVLPVSGMLSPHQLSRTFSDNGVEQPPSIETSPHSHTRVQFQPTQFRGFQSNKNSPSHLSGSSNSSPMSGSPLHLRGSEHRYNKNNNSHTRCQLQHALTPCMFCVSQLP